MSHCEREIKFKKKLILQFDLEKGEQIKRGIKNPPGVLSRQWSRVEPDVQVVPEDGMNIDSLLGLVQKV